jgi:hypothetical protein
MNGKRRVQPTGEDMADDDLSGWRGAASNHRTLLPLSPGRELVILGTITELLA